MASPPSRLTASQSCVISIAIALALASAVAGQTRVSLANRSSMTLKEKACSSAADCNNRGTCDAGICTCDAGYAGKRCTLACQGSTFSANGTATLVCSGHGTCNAQLRGRCLCEDGYRGRDCNTTLPVPAVVQEVDAANSTEDALQLSWPAPQNADESQGAEYVGIEYTVEGCQASSGCDDSSGGSASQSVYEAAACMQCRALASVASADHSACVTECRSMFLLSEAACASQCSRMRASALAADPCAAARMCSSGAAAGASMVASRAREAAYMIDSSGSSNGGGAVQSSGNSSNWVVMCRTVAKTSCEVTGLPLGTLFKFRLKSKFRRGKASEYTSVFEHATRARPPHYTENVPIVYHNLTDTAIQVNFVQPKDIGGGALHARVREYRVDYKRQADSAWTTAHVNVTQGQENSTVTTLSGLDAFTQYNVRTYARNVEGWGNASAIVTIRTRGKCGNSAVESGALGYGLTYNEACDNNGHCCSSSCELKDAAYCSGHGSCTDAATCTCTSGYVGQTCQYSDASTCSGHGTAASDGSCSCASGYTGASCAACASGYYGYPSCQACGCSASGSTSTVCDSSTGQCPCKSEYTGRTCTNELSNTAASCWEVLQRAGGSTPSGVYEINRGEGKFNLYCDMETNGGGWDLVSVITGTNLQFGSQRCTSTSSACFGSITRTASTTGDRTLAQMSDAEVLIRAMDRSGVWTVLTGFSTSSNGRRFLADYAVRTSAISTSGDCTGSNYCSEKQDPSLRIAAYSGWTPHDLGTGLCQWARSGGYWVADTSCGGSWPQHQVDVTYGTTNPAVRYGNAENGQISGSRAAIFFRSKKFRTASTCAQVQAAEPNAASGTYALRQSDGSHVDTHCDMSTDGGGWTLVTPGMVVSAATTAASAADTTGGNGGVVRTITAQANGCGSGEEPSDKMTIPSTRVPWEQVRFTQTFLGSASCYSIFGNEANYRSTTTSGNKLLPFAEGTDAVFAETRMGGENTANSNIDVDRFNNVVQRCDSDRANFWNAVHGNTARSATVILRRNTTAAGDASLSTGASCTNAPTTQWAYSNVFVREEVAVAGTSCLDIMSTNASRGSGYYWVDPDGTGSEEPIMVYCDMETDGGGWTRCRKEDTERGITDAYASKCRDFFNKFGGASQAMVKLWDTVSATSESEAGSTPRFVVRVDGDIGDYFTATSQSGWRYSGISCAVTRIGGSVSATYGDQCWFDHPGAEMCLGGSPHYFCSYSRASDRYRVYSSGSWAGDRAYEVFFRTFATCDDLRVLPGAASGVYYLTALGRMSYCDMSTNGGGWTMIMYSRGSGEAEGSNRAYASVFSSTVRSALYHPKQSSSYSSFKVNGAALVSSASELRYSSYPNNAEHSDPRTSTWTYDYRCGFNSDHRAMALSPAAHGSAAGAPKGIECRRISDDQVMSDANGINYLHWSGCWTGPRLFIGAASTAHSGNNYHGDYRVHSVVTWKCDDSTSGVYSGPSSSGGNVQDSVAFWLRKAPVAHGKSCREILANGHARGSGIYFVDADGQGSKDPFPVYCDMTTDGGGWTLVLKLAKNDFCYGSSKWTDSNPHNEEYTLDASFPSAQQYDAKNRAFYELDDVSELRFATTRSTGTSAVKTAFVSRSSPRTLITSNSVAFREYPDYTSWRTAFGSDRQRAPIFMRAGVPVTSPAPSYSQAICRTDANKNPSGCGQLCMFCYQQVDGAYCCPCSNGGNNDVTSGVGGNSAYCGSGNSAYCSTAGQWSDTTTRTLVWAR